MADDPSRIDLSGRRLTVATPMYEGMCHAAYTRGLVELALLCRERGVALTLKMITNQACLARARAYIANDFVRSGGEHLMMIDADTGFAAADVLSLLAHQASDPRYAMIGGVAARKQVDWSRAAEAARSGADVALPKVAATMAVMFESPDQQFFVERPAAVATIGASFAMIHRSVFERLEERHPELAWKTTEWERGGYGVGERATAFFESMIDPDSGEYLSEDYAFCRRVRDAGMEVWLAPWVDLVHVGNMAFTGSFREMAKLAAHSSK